MNTPNGTSRIALPKARRWRVGGGEASTRGPRDSAPLSRCSGTPSQQTLLFEAMLLIASAAAPTLHCRKPTTCQQRWQAETNATVTRGRPRLAAVITRVSRRSMLERRRRGESSPLPALASSPATHLLQPLVVQCLSHSAGLNTQSHGVNDWEARRRDGRRERKVVELSEPLIVARDDGFDAPVEVDDARAGRLPQQPRHAAKQFPVQDHGAVNPPPVHHVPIR